MFPEILAAVREVQLPLLAALLLIGQLFCEVNPIPVKAAMNLLGWNVGPLRAPLTTIEDAHLEKLRLAMKDYGLNVQ